MPKQRINIGSEPGNQGDGDTLRDAFLKVQHNFSELYTSEFVTDNSIEDHSDPTLIGSIAYALAKAEQEGGGTVLVGPGIFHCNQSLKIRTNVRLIGSGKDTTLINVNHNFNGLVLGSGQNSLFAQPGVEHLSIHLPSDSSYSAIFAQARQCGNGYIQHVKITGGSVTSWGLTMDSCNEFNVTGLVYHGEGNGIRWSNLFNWSANYGDSLISSSDIELKNPGTTGILLLGNTNGIVNNILLSRVEVKSTVGVQTGTKGIELNKTSRITLVNVDVENMHTGFINGPQSNSCTFLNAYAIGCTHDYIEHAPTVGTTIIGGSGDFAEDQRLPTRNLRLYEATFDDYTQVSSGIRDIQAYTDTVNPKQLSLAESGSTLFTNKGATGNTLFVLPNAANSKSLEYSFSVIENHEIQIIPDNSLDHIRGYDGTVNYTPDNAYIYSATPGTSGTIHNADNVWWIMDKRVGTWDVAI